MSMGLFFGSFLLAFSGAMMPGPLLSATIGMSPHRGPWVGPLFIAGHGILEILLISLLLLGLGPLLTSPVAFVAISLSGSAVMLYMAYGMFRSLPALDLTAESGSTVGGSLMSTGALLSLSNPYWIIWWGTIGLGFLMRAREFGVPGVILFFSGHILGDLVWYGFVSWTLWRGRGLLNRNRYRALIALCGTAIGGFGLYFLISGLRPLAEASI